MEQFEAALASDFLRERIEAAHRLAASRAPSALQRLARRYLTLHPRDEQERGVLVSLAARYFLAPEDVRMFRLWRGWQRAPVDAWLWYRALVVEHVMDAERVGSEARSLEHATLQAAALEALATRRDTEALRWLPAFLQDLGPVGWDRDLLVGSAAAIVLAHRDSAQAVEFSKAACALAALLDDERTSERSRRLVRRYLCAALGETTMWESGQQWQMRIQGGEPGAIPRSPTDPLPPFFGIEPTGRSICYVIDVSNSMALPMTEQERAAVREALRPTTPTEPGPMPTESPSVGWGPTKFDAARSALKMSLAKLPGTARFAVIGFGTRARALTPGPGLVPATRDNVSAAIRALDAVEPTPSGALWGSTNLHGALRLAFSLQREAGARAEPHPYAQGGPKSIVLLSDGMPCVDDWTPPGVLEERGGGDYGSFSHPTQFLEDVHRLNLLRKAEIHCVAFGDGNRELLRRIARLGLGSLRVLGGPDRAIIDTRGDPLVVADPDRVEVLLRQLDPNHPGAGQATAPGERIAAIRELERLRVARAVPLLVHALGARDRSERLAALEALAALTGHALGTAEDVETLDRAVRLRGRWRRWMQQADD